VYLGIVSIGRDSAQYLVIFAGSRRAMQLILALKSVEFIVLAFHVIECKFYSLCIHFCLEYMQ
jgi:hypothetical protein